MSKRSKKQVGIQRRLATAKDVIRAKNEAITVVYAIFFTVLHDKEGYGKKRLARVWKNASDLADSVARGYVKISDLEKTLYDELKIKLI